MPYPFWDVPLGYGILMALVAVIHVFVSHFAIGGGLYLVVAERSARKAGDTERLGFVKKLSKFFVLTTVVFGALTGVAIWFIIGLLNPKATEALIHNFVWAWATEWTMFLVEILAAILYFYGWNRLSARRHMLIGWIYFWAAWLSLVVIVGIVTFMLTPGEWLTTGSFWDAFLNPTYFSSVVLRTGICVMLAGLFALLVASRYPTGDLKVRLVRGSALWGVVGLVVSALSWLWYSASVPKATHDAVAQHLTIPVASLEWLAGLSIALFALLVVLGLARPRWWSTPVALVGLLLGLGVFGAYEWYRESARKPYVIHSYMYANGVLVDDVKTFQSEGLLAQATFTTGDDGADIFRYACRSCHTLDGYNAFLPAFDHTDVDYMKVAIGHLDLMRGNMPPFAGTPEEAETLATWLSTRIDPRPLDEATDLTGTALGAAVYELRCGRCHVIGGFNDKWDSLAGEDPELLQAYLEEEVTEEMPVFSGSEAEKSALLEYLTTWQPKEGGE